MISIPDFINQHYKQKYGYLKKGEHLLEFTGYTYSPVTDKDEPQPILPTAKCILCGWSGFYQMATGFECKITK